MTVFCLRGPVDPRERINRLAIISMPIAHWIRYQDRKSGEQHRCVVTFTVLSRGELNGGRRAFLEEDDKAKCFARRECGRCNETESEWWPILCTVV